MKYKIGDRVKIREDLKVDEQCGAYYFVDSMYEMRGLTLTIDKVYADGTYRMKEIGYNWTEEMIEGLSEEKSGYFPESCQGSQIWCHHS